jgi:mevalonate kinase
MISESACGKVILFGEHAVVYGRPALAVPLADLRARVEVKPRKKAGIVIHARDLGREIYVPDASDDEPLAVITRLTLAKLGRSDNLKLTVESAIPVASGLGSGAAISTAIVRALAAFYDAKLSPPEIAELVYETEKLYHGTPSGIDSTVIAYERAVNFVRGQPIKPFQIARPFQLVIANTGIASPTKITVGNVRTGWERHKAEYESIFDEIAVIVEQAEFALGDGENGRIPDLMRRNQQALERLGVSSPEIERLIAAGVDAGASGGKLSGGGRGGNVIFYAGNADAARIRDALLSAGAASVIVTAIGTERGW